MLNQAIKYLLSNYKEDEIDKFISKNYIPDDGDYIVIEETQDGFNKIECIPIKQNKKTKQLEDTTEFINFDFICKADYLSVVKDTNKSIEKKKLIHSNNYLSFFVRKNSISDGKLTNEIIHNYYEGLRNPQDKHKKYKKKLMMYEDAEKEFGKVNEERLNKIEEWIINNIYNLVPKDSKEKTYLKIFFKYDLSEYEKESKKYLIPNIYNSTDFNISINDTLYGLPNNNMGLNSKKPYLENKTRKTTVPFLISLKEVLIQKKLFDFLMNMATTGRVNIYLNEKEIIALSNKESLKNNFQGAYIRIKKGKELEILDFDIIENYKVKLKQPMKVKNILQINYEKLSRKSPDYYHEITLVESLKIFINEILFSKFLDSNYFTEAKDLSINNSNLKMNLLLSRNILFNWFFKGNQQGVWEVLNKTSLSLIKGSINNGYMIRASEQFNLRCALKEYFKGDEKSMADVLKEVKDSLRKKINIKFDEATSSIENDDEYYFAVGQLAGYFISLNKSKNKPHSLANPVINARNDKRIKDELIKLYKKYNYAIPYTKGRFENLMAIVKSYEPKEKVKDDLIIAGYLHSNLIFEKTEDSKNENGGN
ncbi:type I-B CRISPR-associated protein Cas8b/Csh1 [Clostridium haemolyticum]|uniref:type I-B CRISPR-associated protein Cas8b/Csh1 n=1 Tax=Clostridium haemolyticum TaxID=84025 RepID=UPI0009C8969B|nr:type I-B CRISPR-associated protein Cas8b/Csh1 [Clostridium haemolyticum]OOB75084.1 type I-B CRISPR-associated protein Cas8b/Csh1 [Clostridium haemolyticum]